jgi:general L-amino acid transport system permease protein
MTLRTAVREHLFSTWYNALLTVVLLPLVAVACWRVGRLVFVDGHWEVVARNLRLLLIFRYPDAEIWRLWAALFLMGAAFATAAGAAGRRRPSIRRFGPLILLVAVLLRLGGSITALVLVTALTAVVVVSFRLGTRLASRYVTWAYVAAIGSPMAAFAVITGFGGVAWSDWGGLLLTFGLTVGGIVGSFPLGVLLALGRRSSLPAIRVVCVAYIELIRGVPLIAVLFMASLVIGFFLPPGFPVPSQPTRALIAIVLFSAAYMAEVVRGGIQSIHRTQLEAATALGLSPYKTTRLIVLPQAVRAVIPAIVGQFIDLFKDTSLVAVVGLTDVLAVAQIITKQPEFLAQGLIVETLVFASFIYWVGSYSMSRESQRLESRLGVGVR